MIKNHCLLCEIFFSDHKSGVLTSLIGHIDTNQLIYFSNGGNEFVKFMEKHHPPIYKPDVKEIIIYQFDNQYNTGKVKTNLNYLPGNSKVKIS